MEKSDEVELPAFRFPCQSRAKADEYLGILWPGLPDMDGRSERHRFMRDGSEVHPANRFVLYRILQRILISSRLREGD